jgi:hypothetical protein
MIRYFSNAVAILGAAFLALAVASCDAPSDDTTAAGNSFVGKYTTEDTEGKPMTITLSEDGSASGDRAGESLSGSWKEEDGAAMIDWSDEWTTKIAKDGDKYMKTAYQDGTQDGAPVSAEKTE